MKRNFIIISLFFVLALLGAWTFASIDRCGTWTVRPPALTQLSQGRGRLHVGASRVELALRFPTTTGGYGPLHTSVDGTLSPLFARALVFDVGGQKLGLVLLDVLLIPPQLRDAIGQGQAFPTWVLASHTHSGPSGFDPRLASELAALGKFQPDVLHTLASAGRSALAEADAALRPARFEKGESLFEGLTAPRSGSEVDRRLTRLRFGDDQGAIAQVVIAAAHPTVVGTKPAGIHPDWPGLLAQELERNGGPVTLVLQGAGGNASIDRAASPTPEAAASKFAEFLRAVPMTVQPDELDASWTEVHVALERPDASRLVPKVFVAALENALCEEAEDFVVLHGFKLGELRFLTVPFEPSFEAGHVLEEQSRVARVVSLADGYAGYVDTVETARLGQGESLRQYFGENLLTQLAEGARLATLPLSPSP